jgi:cellulose synthase/poly-beta-1,6-N-acetylglucosamine synthase-like glycosyltransferase
MISILLTAWKEEKTIAKVIKCLVDKEYSGILDDFEILLACPDEETYKEAEKTVEELGIKNKFVYVKDPKRGKPFALNLLTEKAKGDIWIFTDGDVYFEKNAVKHLIKHFQNPEVYAVTGRPVSSDTRKNMMGYFGHLLSDAAHHKRTIDLTNQPVGKSLAFVKKRSFFPVSGYIYATRKFDYQFPEDTLVDDAYISYLIFNEGKRIEYEPEAIVYVKYPTTMEDYYKQKKRSVGGYMQLWKYGVIQQTTKTRTFWRELEYFWFPINYAKNLHELFWSFML